MAMTIAETIENTKTLGIDMLSAALRSLDLTEPMWSHHDLLGLNSMTKDLAADIANPRYGKLTYFDYSILATKDDYAIIAYFQPGSGAHGTYGFGVLSDDGDICVEATIHDLVDWILPSDVPDDKLTSSSQLLQQVVEQAERLTSYLPVATQ